MRYSFLPPGLRSADSVAEPLAVLEADPPGIVFHVATLPYNTVHIDRIMEWMRGNYDSLSPHSRIRRLRAVLTLIPRAGTFAADRQSWPSHGSINAIKE